MQSPIRVTFRHLRHSAALEARVIEHAQRLEKLHDRITSCHVVIDGPRDHGEQAGRYLVHIELTIPGGAINASNTPGKHPEHSDPYVALRDAFEGAKRQLLDFAIVH